MTLAIIIVAVIIAISAISTIGSKKQDRNSTNYIPPEPNMDQQNRMLENTSEETLGFEALTNEKPKFEINRSVHAVNESVSSGREEENRKKFQITDERRINPPMLGGTGRLKVSASSRPRKCPQCGGQNNIFASDRQGFKWHCKEKFENGRLVSGCDHYWK